MTTQVPHVPVVTGTVPGSQSVQLSWTYPTVGREDCLPSLYQVQVTPTGDSNAPTLAPVSVTYAMSVVIAGLKPDTQYTATVTAIINERGTDSKPAPFRTGPQGPTAPTGVTAAPDANGGWSVAWSSCGEFSSTCLPSTTWTVVPTICNPQGIGTAPAPFSVAADPTSTVQPGGHLAGGDALLGQSLSFRVQGVGASGVQSTCSMRAAPVASITRRSKPRAAPLAGGMIARASSKSLSIG